MKKIAYIIPGYNQSYLKQKSYLKIAKCFEKQNITPIHVKIAWRKKKPERFADYTKKFLKLYKKLPGGENYILGFSYGATIAFLTAAQTKPKALILCSLSPYFKEDLKKLNPSWLRWWRKNFTESDYSFTEFARKIKRKTHLIVGDKEGDECLRRAKDAKRKLINSSLTIVKGAQHNINQKEYQEQVAYIIAKL